MRGHILNYGIDSTEFQLGMTSQSLELLFSVKINIEWLSVRHPNKTAKAILHQGAPANRRWAVGGPSRSRPGAVKEQSRSIRQSQAARTWINGCQGNIKLTGILSRDVKQLREATLEHHLYAFEWIEWNKCLLTYWKESNNHINLESYLIMSGLGMTLWWIQLL